MATFEELKTGLETAFDADGAKGIEATIQINIEDLTNFYVDINDGALSVVESEHEDPGLTLTFDSQETMEKVLADIDKVIIEKNAGSGVVPYLPLPELKKKVTN
jgi:hypothetical protein